MLGTTGEASSTSKARFARGLLTVLVTMMRWSPVRRGRMRLARRVAPLAVRMAPTRMVRTTARTRVFADLRTGMCTDVYFLGQYEPALTRLVEAVVEPGDRCVDGGAAFGWYTVLCSRLVGPDGAVIAFEPNPEAAVLLRHTVRANDGDNIDLRFSALGAHVGRARVEMPASAPTMGHAAIRLMREANTGEGLPLIEVDTVDTAVQGPIGFMKLDVEGSELAILEGSQRVLRDDRPWLLVEMATATSQTFGYHPNDIVAMLVDHGYTLLAVDEPRDRLIPLHEFPLGHPGANVLCVPPGAEM
ncbi:MAG: FkbM family methyltransferase, partial [Aquihabitans sp.]